MNECVWRSFYSFTFQGDSFFAWFWSWWGSGPFGLRGISWIKRTGKWPWWAYKERICVTLIIVNSKRWWILKIILWTFYGTGIYGDMRFLAFIHKWQRLRLIKSFIVFIALEIKNLLLMNFSLLWRDIFWWSQAFGDSRGLRAILRFLFWNFLSCINRITHFMKLIRLNGKSRYNALIFSESRKVRLLKIFLQSWIYWSIIHKTLL